MKKNIFLVAFVLLISTVTVIANEAVSNSTAVKNKPAMVSFKEREKAFEARLKLTEEQKIKAKEIRIRGHEKIKPVIEAIATKKQEAKMVKMSRIAVEVQEERLKVIDLELKNLEKKAHSVRKSNMKEFESILTREQKKILKQMKNEGRKKYHSCHPSNLMLHK